MLLKPGVDISRLKPPVRKKLGVVEAAFKVFGRTMIITSTCEGDHLSMSLHYADLAVDVDMPLEGGELVFEKIKEDLGKDYDVVNELNHIHIEYDPK